MWLRKQGKEEEGVKKDQVQLKEDVRRYRRALHSHNHTVMVTHSNDMEDNIPTPLHPTGPPTAAAAGPGAPAGPRKSH